MIIPEKHTDPKQKYASVFITLFLCLLGYFIMAYAEVSEVESSRVYMREINEINITRITPEPEPEIEEEPEQAKEAEESPEEAEPEAQRETPRRVNLDDVLPEGVKVDLSVERSNRPQSRQQQQAPESPRSLRIEDSEMDQMGGLSTLSDRGVASRRNNRRTLGNSSDETGGGIQAETGGGLSGARSGGISGGRGSSLTGPRGRDGNNDGVEVGLKDLDEFGEDYSEIDYNAIVDWAKDNPADLPVPVERLMSDGDWDPNYLSSRVPFQINERQFDLMLMIVEERLEVHIFLVENQDVIYLIDRNFQGVSNYLKVGGVGFQEGQIVDVDSQLRNAGQQQTEEFYGIFLSWWDSVRDEYERQ